MNSERIERIAIPIMTKAQRDVVFIVLRDELADEIAVQMATTELGQRFGEQNMRDICRAFACNLRRYVEGKFEL